MLTIISGYKFVTLKNLPVLRETLIGQCQTLDLKGTILLSAEGINIALAGTRSATKRFIAYLATDARFADIQFKENRASPEPAPFRRLRVRLKKEIIRLNESEIDPATDTTKYVSPERLRQWLDDGEDLVLLDTRNRYEVRAGTFRNAVDPEIDRFSQFPQAATAKLADTDKNKKIVIFCTGGIRCEKAGPALQRRGFDNVYQLQGGILKYFEACHGRHWQGECFVFDNRVAVDRDLHVSAQGYCPNCARPLPAPHKQRPAYERVRLCAHCLQAKQISPNKSLLPKSSRNTAAA